MSRFVAVIVLILGLLVASSSPGFADDEEVSQDDPKDDEVVEVEEIEIGISEGSDPNDGQVDFSITRTGDGSSGSGEGSQPLPPGWECRQGIFIENDLVQAVYDLTPGGRRPEFTDIHERVTATLDNPDGAYGEGLDPVLSDDGTLYDTTRQYSPTGQWTRAICTGPDGATSSTDLLPIGGDPVTLGGLFNQAMGQIDPPVHEFEMRPEGKQLVQFPSLLWIEPTYWEADRSATISNGNVSLTVSLVAFETEWEPGDGSDPIVCDGPGEVWERGLDSDAFYCQHTYRSVKDQPFTLTSTVRFETQWDTNSNEVLGPFAPLERVDTVEVEVREIQVVETNA